MEALENLLIKTYVHLDSKAIWMKVFADKDFQKMILDMIRQDQLFEQGINEKGEVIGYYSWVTENLYNPSKKAGTHYTLYDTGEFYKSMVILLGENFFEIDANPIKENDNLFQKYGEGIIGLTVENLERLQKETQERYKKEVERLLSQR